MSHLEIINDFHWISANRCSDESKCEICDGMGCFRESALEFLSESLKLGRKDFCEMRILTIFRLVPSVGLNELGR